MATLSQLHQTITYALAAKRIGRPVHVRYHLNGLLDREGKGDEPLAKIVALVGDWIGQSIIKMHGMRSSKGDASHASLTLRCSGGATAVVSETRGTKAPVGAHLLILGNKGSLQHAFDGATLHEWHSAGVSLPDRDVKSLRTAVEAARDKDNTLVDVAKSEPETPKQPKPPEKKEPRYGVLLVTGSHTHQENYAAAFAADPRCRLIAVTDDKDVDARRRRLNERLARELNIPYIADLEEALKRKDVDVVSICAEPERRGRIAVKCAKAGKHLYLDKSLVPSLAEADALKDAVLEAKVKSHMFSFVPQPWAVEAKSLFDSGRLGTLLAIHADCFFAKGLNGTAKLGTPRKEEYPPKRHQLVEAKREFDNVGVYPLTLIRRLTGRSFKTVFGTTANYFFAEHQKHDVEDFGLLAGKLSNDVPVTIAAGRYGWTSHPAGGVNHMLLVGSEATMLIDANRPRIEVSNDAAPWTPPNVNPEDPMSFWASTQAAVHVRPKTAWSVVAAPFKSDAAYFLDRLDAGKDSEMSVVEAADATEALLATYLSASTNEVVGLPLKR